ncbi:MAG: dienelactone hydrolase family protein [Acidimicrobiales bacterium]
MTTNRTETITSTDGQTFDGHLALPASGHGPGILVIQEIFGVNGYVRDVCDRLAGLGYVSLAPDVFWRIEPHTEFDSSDQATIAPAMEVAGRFDPEAGLADLGSALEHLRGLDETVGATGVIGFCFGGTQTFRVAAEFDPACAVSYYGSGTAGLMDQLDRVHCPMLFHFGGDDPYLPMSDVEQIRAATADRNDITVHVHAGGGHAFDNRFAPHFSQPEIAAAAWRATVTFLYTHLGGPGAGA